MRIIFCTLLLFILSSCGEMVQNKNPLIIDKNSNVNEVIKTLSDFVGESVPIIDKKDNILLGIISENDVLNSYSEISSEIRSIEK